MADTAAEQVTKDAEGGELAPEEDCKAEFKPLVQLEEVETTTGEEDESTLLEMKSKLYRFDSGEWKERGVGPVKLLKHKKTGKTRLIMREEKTLKIRANHFILPTAKLQSHEGNEKAWVFSTVDFADEEQKQEMFCIRFGTVEKAKQFQTAYETAIEENKELLKDTKSTDDPKPSAAATAAAELAAEVDRTVKVSDA